MRRNVLLLTALLLALSGVSLMVLARSDEPKIAQADPNAITQGSLEVVDASGKVVGLCPLKHTTVRAQISGFLSRVLVTQEFENPFPDKIEAVYTFPLPASAAVDDMTMRVGNRTVRGRILPKEQAQAVYDAARNAGQVASLLDQERPNIFTQSVASIMPGEKVFIEISYVETLKYEAGAYEFVFPMVVGPRYNPGTPTGKQGGGFSSDTTQVPDASRITPQVAAAGTRAGHDISIEVLLDAGVPIDEVKAQTHEIEIERQGERNARVQLRKQNEIPNKDFILKYEVAGRKVQDALLTHRSGKGGFFTFILQPPDRVTAEDVMPKELVFVIDTSGSMHGFPLEKAKETMKLAMDNLYPQDTFNLITFAGDTHILFPQPVPATKENLEKAQKFLKAREGGGGTEMMKAIKAALDPTDSQAHVRIVCFMTDGYVGNDMEILGEIQKHPNARVFSFGIGGSVNRFLLDKMAEEGRGEVEYVALNDDGSAAARRFHERVRSPLLTDIQIEWAGLPIADVYPKRIPDLFSAKPVILTGRYTGNGKATIKLKGKMSGREYVREIPVELPEAEGRHDVLATLWARTRIDDLMSKDWNGIQQGNAKPDVEQEITQLGLEYRLMTQYTSFVAVEEMTITEGGVPRKVEVPVELPEGVSRAGALGEDDDPSQIVYSGKSSANFNGGVSGTGRGAGGGAREERRAFSRLATSGPVVSGTPSPTVVSAGVLNSKAVNLPKPKYPQTARAARTSGAVSVQVIVDESGKVTSATAISGNPVLRTAAVAAAWQAKFSPVLLSGQSVKTTGTVTYNFDLSGGAPSATANMPDGRTILQAEPQAKLHPSIAALIERIKNKSAQPVADEAKFVRDGKAEIQIWLVDKSPQVIAELQKLGFELVLDPQSAKMVIGRISLEKLAALREVKAVRYITPQITSN